MAKPSPELLADEDRPNLFDMFTTYNASPDSFGDAVYCTEESGIGRAGPSLGNIPLLPLETLSDRIVAAWGAPLKAILRMSKKKTAGGGFTPAYFHEVSDRAAQRAPPPTPAETVTHNEQTEREQMKAELQRLRDKLENPQAIASVPTDPFNGAQRLFDLTMSSAKAMMATQTNQPHDVEKIIALAKEAADKTDTKLGMFREALPYVAGAVDKFFDLAGRTLDARREEVMRQHAQRNHEAGSPAQPASAVFAGHGVTTGEGAEVAENKGNEATAQDETEQNQDVTTNTSAANVASG